MTTEIATLLAASIAAIAAIAGAVVNYLGGVEARERTALAEIAAHRVRWIEDLRILLVEFYAKTFDFYSDDKKGPDEVVRICELCDLITLLVNSDEHKRFIKAVKSIKTMCVEKYQVDSSQKDSLNTEFGKHSAIVHVEAQTLLKNEWEKVKSEIRGETA